MTTYPKLLRIGHLNVRSLERHIDGVKLMLDRNQYHFFGVTETKLNQSSPIGPVRIPAYNFIKHSLSSGRGRGTKTCGGVGIYISKNIKAATILKSCFDPAIPINQRLEFLAIRAKIGELNTCIVVLYNPASCNTSFAQQYEKLLLDLLEYHFDRIFLVGDYNINVAANQPTANLLALQRIHTSFNLTVLPTSATRITEHSSTTIDLLVTDHPQFIKKSKTLSANSISDHEAVYLIADSRIPEAPPRRIQVRNLRGIDPLRLQADYQAKDLQDIYLEENIDIKTQLLHNELRSLLDQHAPERTVYVRDKRTPWITNEIQNAIAIRDLAYSLYARNPNRARGDAQWQNYISKKSRTNNLINTAKKRYADSQFSSDLPAKQLWSNLKRAGIHNTKTNHVTEELDAEQLNQFFAEGHLSLQHQSSMSLETLPNVSTMNETEGGFRFRNTNVEEICKKIYQIDTNAIGTDEIPISFIKMLCPFVLPLLTHLFNAIIEAQSFPSLWKEALITPIPKTSNPATSTDFRPISVLPAVSKPNINLVTVKHTAQRQH
ncbi:uncharacterized protein LOC131681179 [Topomyia yanbarensis]|uniref:uncharacterized protein LOC131681179 n=1 Tax=Topomyia yanbarensis TaxID=2498891 RepID=UPI00273CD144|nr:uncharacterized protein LOC131681179 [Topomyia yanbarensis]